MNELRFQPGTIICCMGTLGAGKSLLMTLLGHAACSSGQRVYVNYETLGWGERIGSLKHLVSIHDGVLLLDELQAIFDSREFGAKLQKDLSQWAVLIRKLGLSLIYTSQHISFVDTRIRQITDFVIWSQKSYHYGARSSTLNVFRTFGDELIYQRRSILVHKPWMYALYNTKDTKVQLTLDGYKTPFDGLSDSYSAAPARKIGVADGAGSLYTR